MAENVQIIFRNLVAWIRDQSEQIVHIMRIWIHEIELFFETTFRNFLDAFEGGLSFLGFDTSRENIEKLDTQIANTTRTIEDLKSAVREPIEFTQIKGIEPFIDKLVDEFGEGFGNFEEDVLEAFKDKLQELLRRFGIGTGGPNRNPILDLLFDLSTVPLPKTLPESTPEFPRTGAGKEFRDPSAGTLARSLVDGIDDAIKGGGAEALGFSLLEGINDIFRDSAVDIVQAGINGLFEAAFGDTLANIVQSGMNSLFSSAFDALGSLFSGLLSAGAGAAAGGAGGGTFHEGGIVGGRRGSDVPILAQAGEIVLTRSQQRALLAGGTGNQVTVNIQATGDVTDATQRALLSSGRMIGDLVVQQFAERRIIGV